MEADRRPRTSSKTTKAATNKAAGTPTVSKRKTPSSTPRQPKGQPKETAAKRKRDGEPTDPLSKKLKEAGVKNGDESASPAEKKSPLPRDDNSEDQEAEGDPDTDPVSQNVDPAPNLSASSGEHAEVDEPVQVNQELPPANTPVPGQNDNGSAQGRPASDRSTAKAKDFLRALVSNVARHKLVRRMTYGRWMQVKRADQIKNEIAEIAEKQLWLREMERTMGTRQQNSKVVKAMEDNELKLNESNVDLRRYENAAHNFESLLNSLSADHASRSNGIYEFHDVDQSAPELENLPASLWYEFDRCHKAHTTCKKIEEDIAAAERQQDSAMEQSEEFLISVICPRDSETHAGTIDVPETPLVQTSKSAGVPIRAHGVASACLISLHEKLEDARDEQYREGQTLHGIAEKAFIAAGFLAVDTQVGELEFKRHTPGKHREGGQKTNTPEDAQPHVQESHKAELASQVKHARRRLVDSQRKLDDDRWGPLTDAGSMDSDERGAARVHRMIKRTREVRTAQEAYHLFLRNAQDEGAIHDVNQWQTSKDHGSLRWQGFPMPEKKQERVDRWAADVSEKVGLHAVEQATVEAPEQRFADQMNWRPAGEEASVDSEEQQWAYQVSSLGFGEDIEMMEDRSGVRKLIDKMIAQTEQIRGIERGEMAFGEAAVMTSRPFENPENDFHVSHELSAHEGDMEIDGST